MNTAERRTAAVLATVVILMVAAGVGLVLMLRQLSTKSGPAMAPGKLEQSYLEEVEARCGDRYTRPSLPHPGRGSGEASSFYLAARDALPDLDAETWLALEEGMADLSWSREDPPQPGAAGFDDAAQLVLQGACSARGRSPYAFCAIDTDGAVLLEYTNLSVAVQSEARSRFVSGDEKLAADLLAAGMIMQLDMGRGGGTLGHAMAVGMVADTLQSSMAGFIGASRDENALAAMERHLSIVEGAWIDLADNARIDAVVIETMFAACFMPPGWRSPVGPPVITPEDQESICNLGPLALRGMWKAMRARSDMTIDALGQKDSLVAKEMLDEIEKRDKDASVLDRLLDPGEAFADLVALDVRPQFEADLRARTLLVLARTALAMRLAYLRDGRIPDLTSTALGESFDGTSSLLVDPIFKERPVVELYGSRLVLRSHAPWPGWNDDPPNIEVYWEGTKP